MNRIALDRGIDWFSCHQGKVNAIVISAALALA